jgi:hypothetical protein
VATTLTWETGGRIVAVALDACTTQAHEITAEPTEHAVERGAAISDHVLHPRGDRVADAGHR